jgi:hypothetical protein
LVERLLGITPHLTRQMEARIAAMQAAPTGDRHREIATGLVEMCVTH